MQSRKQDADRVCTARRWSAVRSLHCWLRARCRRNGRELQRVQSVRECEVDISDHLFRGRRCCCLYCGNCVCAEASAQAQTRSVPRDNSIPHIRAALPKAYFSALARTRPTRNAAEAEPRCNGQRNDCERTLRCGREVEGCRVWPCCCIGGHRCSGS